MANQRRAGTNNKGKQEMALGIIDIIDIHVQRDIALRGLGTNEQWSRNRMQEPPSRDMTELSFRFRRREKVLAGQETHTCGVSSIIRGICT